MATKAKKAVKKIKKVTKTTEKKQKLQKFSVEIVQTFYEVMIVNADRKSTRLNSSHT